MSPHPPSWRRVTATGWIITVRKGGRRWYWDQNSGRMVELKGKT